MEWRDPSATRGTWGAGLVLSALAVAAACNDSPTDAGPGEEPIEFVAADRVALGDEHTCALDGDGRAFCWGDNRYGQLGDSTLTDRASPTPVEGGHRFEQLAAAGSHTCGLDTEGRAWCWGQNDAGALGTGAIDFEELFVVDPRPVAGDHVFVDVSAGGDNTCGVDDDGQAWCWGDASEGKLGTGATSPDPVPTPTRVSGVHDFVRVSTGDGHACALDAEGRAWCWGSNQLGELGDGSTTPRTRPVAVRGAHRFTQVVAGSSFTCALDVEGEAWCWGAGYDGRLGTGDSEHHSSPTRVDFDETFDRLAKPVRGHVCALTGDGEAFCWGANYNGAIGDGTEGAEGFRSVPTPVAGSLVFTGIDVGGYHSCGTTTEGDIYCWGAGGSGQLGNGESEDSTVPVEASPLEVGEP